MHPEIGALIDVLHYLETHTQVALLERIAQSLRGGGLFILRVADGSAGWRFRLGKAGDRFGSLLTGRGLPHQYHRRLDEWFHLLDELRFEPSVEPNTGQSFANALVWAKSAPVGRA